MLFHSKIHKSKCQLLEEETLWGKTVCKIWLIPSNKVVTVPKEDLIDAVECDSQDKNSKEFLKYDLITQAACCKVNDAIASCGKKKSGEEVLLAPLESAVTPLPYQLNILKNVIKRNPARFLLADEVGLGKTIEAGLIMQELKLRGLVKRVLIVVPTGLINQWIAEMKTHFNEEFQHYIPSELANFSKYFHSLKNQFELKNINNSNEFNPWTLGDNIICPMDAIKPLINRKGWTKEEIEKHNSERFLNVINAGWDLVIIDEAHRVAGADSSVARYKLGWGLGQATPHILLLSATPHQGKSDAFHRLFTILDEDAFPDERHVTRKTIEPYLLRNEKRAAKDSQGNLLFKPRKTKLCKVTWSTNHRLQNKLYEEVTEYIKEGYNSIERLSGSQKAAIGFLLVLIQRLVTSSTAAVAKTLERRLSFLKGEIQEEQQKTSNVSQEEWEDMDGDQQIETSMSAKVINRGEIKYVESLLHLAQNTLSSEIDVKTEKLLSLIYDLQVEEDSTDLKLLIFTEFTATQQMLADFLQQRGFVIAMINGSMPLDERYANMKDFANQANIMIATEAGGEGLNLQFCHVIVNYDMPWNPMRIEQRIGRVDRIGQKKDVLAVNMMINNTVECRVREIIETKLQVILAELGVDKLGDILDSAEAGKVFEKIYTDSIKDDSTDSIDKSLDKLKDKLKDVRKFEELYLPKTKEYNGENPDYTHHPFPFWVEQMTINYILKNNGKAARNLDGWEITWPDGEKQSSLVFSTVDLEKYNDSTFLSIADRKLKTILKLQKSSFNKNCIINIDTLPDTVSGIWSLWEIKLSNNNYSDKKILPLFVHDNGKVFPSTAKAVWDSIISGNFDIVNSSFTEIKINELKKMAETNFDMEYQEMFSEFNAKLTSDKIKKEKLFESKAKAINQVGIENIRQSRIKNLEEERKKWMMEIDNTNSLTPSLNMMMVVKIKP